MRISNRKGEIVIPRVPPGHYTLKTWAETALPENLNALTREVTISDSSSSLGVLEITAGMVSTAHKNKFGMDYEPPAPKQPRLPTALIGRTIYCLLVLPCRARYCAARVQKADSLAHVGNPPELRLLIRLSYLRESTFRYMGELSWLCLSLVSNENKPSVTLQQCAVPELSTPESRSPV